MSTPETSGDEAREALQRMDRKLREQVAKGRLIDRIVRALSSHAEDNHFSMRMRDLYRGDI